MSSMKKFEELSDLEIRILEKARKEFEANGFHRTNVENIADALGIGKGTIYRHFGTKILLFMSVGHYVLHMSRNEIQKAENVSEFEESLDIFINALIRISLVGGSFMKGLSDGNNFYDSKSEIMKNKDVQKFLKHMLIERRSGISILAAILDKGKSEGKIADDVDAMISAEIIFIGIGNFIRLATSFSSISKSLGLENPIGMDKAVEELRKFMKRGLALNHQSLSSA